MYNFNIIINLFIVINLISVNLAKNCDTFPLCQLEINSKIDNSKIESNEEIKVFNIKNINDETTMESPLFVQNSITEIAPMFSAFRDFRLFDEDKTNSVEKTTSYDYAIEYNYNSITENPILSTSTKKNNAMIIKDLTDFDGRQKILDDRKRSTVGISNKIISTLVFPPLPRDEQYKVQTYQLDDGYFIFNFLSTLLSYIQPTAYPIDLVREALQEKINLIELFTQSTSNEAGTIILITFAALFGILTPVLLISICCSNLIKNCKNDKNDEESHELSDTSSTDDKYNCKRRSLTFLLFILLTITGIGITGVIITNEDIGFGTRQLPTVVDTSLLDIATFIRNSHQTIKFILTSSIDQVVEVTTADLDNIQLLLGQPIQSEVASETGVVVALDVLTDITKSARDISDGCNKLYENADTSRELAKITQDRLSELRTQIDNFKRQCSGRYKLLCDTLDTSGLDINLNFDKLLSDVKLMQLKRLKNDTLSNLVQQARTQFQFVPDKIETDTRDARNGIRRNLEMKRNELYDSLKPFQDLYYRLEQSIHKARDYNFRFFEKLPELEQWRWLFGLCTGVLLLLIWIFLFSAIACGCCGAEREAGCSIKTSMAFLGFLSTLLWAITLATFILGSRGEILICRVLHEEPNFQILSSLFDKPPFLFGARRGFFSNLAYSNNTLDIDLPTVLRECRDNRASYEAFELEKVINIEKLSDHNLWNGYHRELLNLNVDLRHLQMLSPDLSRKLSTLIDITAIDLATYRKELGGHVTTRDIKSFATQLEGVSNQIREQSMKSRLDTIINRVKRLLSNNIQPLEKQKDELVYQMTTIEFQLGPLQKQVNQSFVHLKKIQYYINNQGSEIAQEKSNQYTLRLLNYVQQFQDYVVNSIKTTIAPCRPLWDSFYAVRQITCPHLNEPLNGFWFSLSISLLSFLTIIPVGLGLLNLYSKLKKTSILTRTTEGQDSPPSTAWTTQNADNEDMGNW